MANVFEQWREIWGTGSGGGAPVVYGNVTNVRQWDTDDVMVVTLNESIGDVGDGTGMQIWDGATWVSPSNYAQYADKQLLAEYVGKGPLTGKLWRINAINSIVLASGHPVAAASGVVGDALVATIQLAPVTMSAEDLNQQNHVPSQVLRVTNTGTATLQAVVTSDAAWLGVSDSVLSLAAGTTQELTITFDTAALVADVYTGHIEVTDPSASNDPQTLTVTLTVTALPAKMTVTDAVIFQDFYINFTLDASSALYTGPTGAAGAAYFAGWQVQFESGGLWYSPDSVDATPGVVQLLYLQQGFVGGENFRIRNNAAPFSNGLGVADQDGTIDDVNPRPAFYVNGATGDDGNDGSSGSPWATIQHATDNAGVRSVIHIAAGTYAEYVTVAASDQKFIGTGWPVVDATGLDYGFYVEGKTGVEITGLKVTGATINGIHFNSSCSRCKVYGNQVYGNGYDGIMVQGGDTAEVYYNDVHDNGGNGIDFSYYDNSGPLQLCDTPYCHHNLCYDNGQADEENGDGITSIAAYRGRVEYNLCWGNLDDGIDMSAPNGGGGLIYSQECTIRFNAVWDSQVGGTGVGDGNGIKVSTNYGGAHTVAYNVCFRNTRAGIDCDQEGNYGSNFFYHNTLYDNTGYGLVLDMAGVNNAGSGARVLSNILKGNGDDYHHSGTYQVTNSDYNFVGDGSHPTLTTGGATCEVHSLLAGDPLFADPDTAIDTTWDFDVDGTIAEKWDYIWGQVQTNFALQVTSPCRGTADDGFHMGAVQ